MSLNSFGKASRLINGRDFRRVREKGAFFRDKTFTIAVLKNSAQDHRLGISIGKSAIRLASKRNRQKRILRELFRTHKNQIRSGPYDIVCYVKKQQGRNDIDYYLTRSSFLALMKKAKLLC